MDLVTTCWDAFCVFSGMGGAWLTHVKIPYSTRWHGIGLINTCWGAFCVLAGVGGVLSTQFEIHFESFLSLDEFSWQMLRSILCTGWHRWVWSTHVWCIFCSLWDRRGLLNTCLDAYFVHLARDVWSTLLKYFKCTRWNGMSLFIMLRCILCPCWHGRGWSTLVEVKFVSSLESLYNTCWDAFWDLDSMGWVGSTLVEINFVFLPSWNGFGQHKLRYIWSSSWNWMRLIGTCWEAFCVQAGIGGFGQHKLRCILCPC